MAVNPSSTRPSVARSAGIVGFFTLLSRFGGLFRDAVFANLFGASTASDAYLMAFTIPNTFRTLVAEGSLTVAFLPVFREVEAKGGPSAGNRLFSHALAVFPGLAAVISGLAVLAAVPLVGLFAPGFRAVEGKFELTVTLTRLMFAYLPLVSVVALSMGALNARRHFATSAAAPLVFNFTVIAGILTAGSFASNEFTVHWVAMAVVLGGVSQVALQSLGLRRAGISIRPQWALSEPIRRILRLMLPAVGALAVYQFNILIVRNVASALPEGAVTSLFYADRFFQLPLGVFGIAIATASLPAFADAQLEGGATKLADALSRSLELIVFIAIPSSAGLFALALPITSTVLQHGAFSHSEARSAASVLELLAIGLAAVASIRVVSQAFFSMQDTRTPVACSGFGVLTNFVLAAPLAQSLGTRGLALSLSLAAWGQLLAQWVLLRQKLGGSLQIHRLLVKAVWAGGISCVMAWCAWMITLWGDWEDGLSFKNATVLIGAVSTGAIAYGVLQFARGAPEAKALAQTLERRVLRKSSST